MVKITHIVIDEVMKCKPATVIEFHESVGQWLGDNWEKGKPFAVFDGQPCAENDITFDENGLPNVELLCSLTEGEFFICETPAAAGIVPQIAISLIISFAVNALTPKPQLPENVNRRQQSPNNSLSSRSNVARPLERIPDIKGQVKSIPDVIAPTYVTYENDKEIEHGFYCVGRKQYQIENLKDGETPVELIDGASAGVYYPNNSPNLGAPDVAINGHQSEPVVAAYRSNQVNGLTISPDFVSAFIDATQAGFNNLVGQPTQFSVSVNGALPSAWIVGDNAIFINVIVQGNDISGTYELLAANQAPGFYSLQFEYGVPFPVLSGSGVAADSGTIEPENAKEFTDWVYNTAEKFNRLILNINAPNGLYKDTGVATLKSYTVDYTFEIEGVDESGAPDGNVITIDEEITRATQQLAGQTTFYEFSSPTRFRVRVKNNTVRFTGSAQVVEQIKLEDVYGIVDIDATDFGDVTTIQTRTEATPFATAVKERQLNCIATELVDVYQGSGVFAGVLTPNRRAVQSFIKDALDPGIGNRTLSEIEADELLALDADINTYFGNTRMGEFSYTFDSTNISFQEYTQTIFNAVFCIAYRENGKISSLLEQAQSTPAMLFTHRSKQPKSETHSRNFNPSTINDGVEFTYVDPDKGYTSQTIYIPENKSAVNPKKFDIPGIQNRQQALVRARREYQKLLHQKISLDVTVTAEGRYIRPLDMVSVVKGTRVKTYDGEVIGQDGLTLTLSADVEFGVGTHTIVLKDETGSTESIEVTAGATASEVILAAPPTQTIRTGIDTRRTEFSFGEEAKHLADYWLTQEIDISDKSFVNLKAINYTDDYYSQDTVSVNAFSSGFSEGFS